MKPEILTSPDPKPFSGYVWAVIILMLLTTIMIMAIIWLRPASDPLIIIAGVMTAMTPTTAAVLALMKAQETHLSVNSRLDEFMNQHAKSAHSEGILQGVQQEQDRTKEKQRHEQLMRGPAPTPPIETIVKNSPADPVPIIGQNPNQP